MILRALLIFGLSAASAASAEPGDAAGNLVVPTVNGPVQGVFRDFAQQSASWWGIRYAEPPVGANRFKEPKAYKETWTTPRLANQIPIQCIQLAGKSTSGSEDCLFLNVHAPAIKNSSALPVMVFFYGGGFSEGSSYEMGLYDGQHLSSRHDVIIVTLNYRLCALGFMALDALQNEHESGSTGNHGLQDQQMALQWVRQNIRYFGGNPQLVTIFGESAGAFSVMWHLVSPKSKGLFQAAIMESGTVDVTFFFQPLAQAKAYYEDLAKRLGCPTSPSQLECLRKLPAPTLIEVESGLDGHRPKVRSPLWPLMPNGPAIDGTESGLLDVPMKLVREGRFNRVPLLLGSNENGGSIFEPMLPIVLPGVRLPVKRFPETLDIAMSYFFQDNVSKVEAVYLQKEFGDGDKLIKRMIRDLIFMCPLRALASAWFSSGLPTILYVFDFSYGLARWIGLGDFHGSELPFVFRNWLEFIKPIDPFQSPRRMSDIISCKWTSFAHGHDPNGGTNESKWLPGCQDIHGRYSAWPSFGPERFFYTLKAVPEVHGILADNYYPDDTFPRDEKCDLWDHLGMYMPWVYEDVTHSEKTLVV